ncbi:DUF11 domain-containing protein [Methanobrevibacter oralis]|uniref:DUF11 domain-containing protein n=1 Tax=Methanobrevibacter oralis TaxID=66851 RepID=UPI001C73BBF0|nr:DUF11 domain-containing protein [Methanobrevibacter oralis]
MLEKDQKITIIKYIPLILSMFILVLLMTTFAIDEIHAVELNESSNEVGLLIKNEDKLENSQEKEILSTTYSSNGGTFTDIKNLISRAKAGDTINLNGNFYADKSDSPISVNKKLKFTSKNGAVLNGKGITRIMNLPLASTGTTLFNLKFINGNTKLAAGAILLGGNNLVIDKCVFNKNHAKNGGAIYSAYNSSRTLNLIIKNCNFTKNTALRGGGAVSAFGNNSKVINCIFDSNGATNKEGIIPYGGALQIGMDEKNIVERVSKCIFKNNYVSYNGNDPIAHGGAGCVRFGTTYEDCVFINNRANQGGALTFHSSGSIKNCKFYNNTAYCYGGALSTGFLIKNNKMNLNVNNCIFECNKAPLGGAVQLCGLNVNMNNNTFNRNKASKNGGAINIEATTVKIDKSRFNNNIANVNGGAIFIIGNNTFIKNSVFIANSAIPDKLKLDDGLGGAIYVNSTLAEVSYNIFNFNTARNGSAVYYDKYGDKLSLINNEMFQNQAWVYKLPIYARNIYYGDVEEISSIIHGGNNIADYDNLAVSNAIYNAAKNSNIVINGQNPVSGATNTGKIYQDDREYNMDILLSVTHEDGTLVYNNTLKSSYLGKVDIALDDLKVGKYYVKAQHFEDTYYKGITNVTSFIVSAKVDNEINKSTERENYNFEEIVIWTLNFTNNGPCNASGVLVHDVLPEGLIWISDDSEGKYDSKTGILTIGDFAIGERIVVNILTVINKTGKIINRANITANEYDFNLSNNNDEVVIVVNPACDVDIIKTVNNSLPNYGDIVKWTLVITNHGPDVAHDVIVSDILPNGLILINSTGSFDVPILNVGESVVIEFITKVNKTGLIENNASVSLNEFDHDLSNNNDSEIIKVNPACDLEIVKSSSVSQANYKDIIKWTIKVSNNGPDNATGVKIIDILPNALIYLNSTENYENNTFNIGNLAIGESISIDIFCKVNVTGNITNWVNVSGNEYDFNLDNNKDSASIYISPASDIAVTKTVNETDVNFGDLVKWVINVTNNGPDVAHNIVINDEIPDSLIVISNNGGFNIDKLDVGKSVILEIITKVNKTGVIENEVSVTAQEFDYNLENNQDNDFTSVNASADVQIIKTVNETSPNYGDLVKWKITISNNGPNKATGVYVEDRLPEGLVLVEYYASKGSYENGIWSGCCLENGEEEYLELICLVNKTGQLINIVTIYENEYDPNLKNNNDSEIIDVPPACDISVTKEVNNKTPFYGDKITWIITITNNGPNTASGVVVNDDLPSGLILTNYTASKGTYNKGIWSINSLNKGESQILTITCIINELGETTNFVDATANEYDWNLSNNYANESINTDPICDLSIEKLVNQTNPNYLDLVKWVLIITNNGPNNASDVVVCDTLPNGLELISCDGNYDGEFINVGQLNVGDRKEFEIICKVTKTGKITNTASIACNEEDSNLDNNYAEKSIDVPPAADLAITKTVTKFKYKKGDLIEYFIKLTNKGPSDAKNIKVKEILESPLILKSFKVSNGDFNQKTNIWSINKLAAGGEADLKIKALANKSGVFKNEVQVTSDNYDPDLENNNDSVEVNVTESPNKTSKKVNLDKKSIFKPKTAYKNAMALTTANPIAIFLCCILASLVFSIGNLFKRR